MILVSAAVMLAMGLMFVGCNKDEVSSIGNGCTCTETYNGETETVFISGEDMKEVAEEMAEMGIKINSCSDYSDYVMKYVIEVGSIKCK